MKKVMLILAIAVFSVVSATAQTKYIGMKKARAIALKTAPGKIKSGELEKEHGKMIYSFDIRTAKGKMQEVGIDAVSGEIVENKTESAADEAKEKAADKMMMKKKN